MNFRQHCTGMFLCETFTYVANFNPEANDKCCLSIGLLFCFSSMYRQSLQAAQMKVQSLWSSVYYPIIGDANSVPFTAPPHTHQVFLALYTHTVSSRQLVLTSMKDTGNSLKKLFSSELR